MYELERWNTSYYPSHYEYVGSFGTLEDAMKEARLQRYGSWRVITVEAQA